MIPSTPLHHLSGSALDLVGSWIHRSVIDTCRCLPAFAPNSVGDHQQRSRLTLEAANETFPLLARLCARQSPTAVPVIKPSEFAENAGIAGDDSGLLELKSLLDRYGSDKANHHDYHFAYAVILRDRGNIANVLEIGLGSNDPSVVSNMKGGGSPGGSLRAMRDFASNARIYGADIDPAILFREDRIETFVVDQLSTSSLDALGCQLPASFDLIIDDGLHAPHANINTLIFGLSRLKSGGWIVIEDIAPSAVTIWQVVGSLLAADFKCFLLDAKGGWLFAVQSPTVLS